MAKVYVSSTIIDLRPERYAVQEWLRLARHQAVDSYLPDCDTVRESCLDDVGRCDLYVLILGHWPQSFRAPEVWLLIALVPGFGFGVRVGCVGGRVAVPGVPGCAPAPTAPGSFSFRVDGAVVLVRRVLAGRTAVASR
jgi:hypothetical protein